MSDQINAIGAGILSAGQFTLVNLGGDRFLAFLKTTDVEVAHDVAAQLRRVLRTSSVFVFYNDGSKDNALPDITFTPLQSSDDLKDLLRPIIREILGEPLAQQASQLDTTSLPGAIVRGIED